MLAVAAKGVYVLLIELADAVCTSIGSLGYVCLDRGVYAYVGSAKGFGGIEARVRRHLAKDKRRLRWHIDYVTTLSKSAVRCVIYAEDPNALEEDLVKAILGRGWSVAIHRFGSTDRRSPSHLLRCWHSYDTCVESVKQAFAKLGLEPRELDPRLLLVQTRATGSGS